MRRIHVLVVCLLAAFCLVTSGLFVGCGNIAPFPGDLTVNSEPAGAVIVLDGTPTDKVTPHTFDAIDAKVYTVAVSMDGFMPSPDSQTVDLPFGGSATANFELTELVGSLTVTSEPADAAIALDGVDTGELTPHTFVDIEARSYTVTVVLAGWTVYPEEIVVDLPAEGSESVAFTLSQMVGSLTVTSDPSGAAIELDDVDTGEATPHTFENLVPRDYDVSVSLVDHVADPPSITVTVVGDQAATADFTLTSVPRRIVLFEGFSSTYCIGCPDFNDNVGLVMAQPGYGTDRLLYVKWPAFLSNLDPFYFQTQSTTNGRVAWYDEDGNMSLPTCYADGALLGSEGVPPDDQGMLSYIDAQPEFADFRIIVETDEDLTDVTDLIHNATVTLAGPDAVDLSGHVLNVVLVYEEVETEDVYPYGNGTEFHWVMRDFYQTPDPIGQLAAGVPLEFPVTLVDPDPDDVPFDTITPHGKQIIAWVQNSSSKAVLQAGSTVDTSKNANK